MRQAVAVPAISALLALGSAAPLAAEGAVQQLACEVAAACDPLGACAAGGTVGITLAPIATEGTINVIALTIDGTEAEALQDGALGALEWTTETASHWLIPSGPTSLVWVTQTQGESLWSETRILVCSGAG